MSIDSYISRGDHPYPELVERGHSFVGRNAAQPIDDFVSFFRNRFNDSYMSGTFEFEVPEVYDGALGTGSPDIFNRSLQFYYNTLNDFCFATPHSAKWAVFIRPHNQKYLMSEISKLRETYEPWNSSEDWNIGKAGEYLMRPEAQETIGCIFALSVSGVGENIGTSMMGGASGANNGFLKSPISQNRQDNSPIDITVKETNCSYSDFVVRPWTIIASHKGFHARPHSEDIKADITVFELANNGIGNKPLIRRVINYYDCLPISVNGEPVEYEQDKLIQRQISFAYNYYTIQTGVGFGEGSDAKSTIV